MGVHLCLSVAYWFRRKKRIESAAPMRHTINMQELWSHGYARLGTLLDRRQCEETRALYARPELFRSRIEMARFRFGRGEYQYFSYPLPPLVDELRRELYSRLVSTARDWMAALSLPKDYPPDLEFTK